MYVLESDDGPRVGILEKALILYSGLIVVGEYYWVRLTGSNAATNGGQMEVNAVQEK